MQKTELVVVQSELKKATDPDLESLFSPLISVYINVSTISDPPFNMCSHLKMSVFKLQRCSLVQKPERH